MLTKTLIAASILALGLAACKKAETPPASAPRPAPAAVPVPADTPTGTSGTMGGSMNTPAPSTGNTPNTSDTTPR